MLLRGEPGTGKSQLAHAAAVALNRLFVYEVVNAHTEGQDLLWKFDAVSRLAEAQTIKAGDDKKALLDTKLFISPGVLWWALDWDNACEVYDKSHYQLSLPEKPENWQQPLPGGNGKDGGQYGINLAAIFLLSTVSTAT